MVDEGGLARRDLLPGTLNSTSTRDLGELFSNIRFYLTDRIVVKGSVLSEVSYGLESTKSDYLVSLVHRARQELGLQRHNWLKFNLFFSYVLRKGHGDNSEYHLFYASGNTCLRARYFTFFPGSNLNELRRELERRPLEEKLSENVSEESKEALEAIVSVIIRFLHKSRNL